MKQNNVDISQVVARADDMHTSYEKLYLEEKTKNEELQKAIEDLKEKLGNMTENAMVMFNERGESVSTIQSLKAENNKLINEVEFLKKAVEANMYYRKIAEGFVGLANMEKGDIEVPDEQPNE